MSVQKAHAGASTGAGWTRSGRAGFMGTDEQMEGNIYLEMLQEKKFVFSLSSCDLSILSIHLLVLSIFFSPTSENRVKLLPSNTYKKVFVLPLEGKPKDSSRALHRGIERDYFMSS